MQYKVAIDVSPYVSALYNRYEGDLTKKQWLKKEKVNQKAIEYVKNKLCEHDFFHIENATFDFKQHDILTYDVEIIFTWQEKENIHVWRNEVKQDIETIYNVFAGQFIVTSNVVV